MKGAYADKNRLKPYRQMKWMAKGIADRLPGQKKTREPSVQTEA